jgi:Flp pilus assembly protein TadG
VNQGKRQRRKERGATIVEAAITMLLLLMFLDGILEFGRAYNVYHVMTNAAREGARYAVAPLPGTSALPTATAVQAEVNSFLASGGVTGATVAVNTTTQTVNAVALTYTSVQVSAPYQFGVAQLLGISNSTVNLTTTAEMRNETN